MFSSVLTQSKTLIKSQRPRILSSLCIFLETEQWDQRTSLRGQLSVCILSPPAWSQTNCKQAAGGTKMVPLTSPRVRPELLCEVWSECTPDLTCPGQYPYLEEGRGGVSFCGAYFVLYWVCGSVGLWACGQCGTRQLSRGSPSCPHPPNLL